MFKGQIISGEFDKIIIRQKSGQLIELGELLIAEEGNKKYLFQVYDLIYSSQISQQNLELISGLNLEEDADYQFMEKELRNYNLAYLKPLLVIESNRIFSCKSLPPSFSRLRMIKEEDLTFLTKPKEPLFLGYLRSGSQVLDLPVLLPGKETLSHHLIIAASTGKGKSNLCSVILWNLLDQDYAGILVLDPHDEYFGRNGWGLKDHPQANKKLVYYSPNPPPGGRSLRINLQLIKPNHFQGIINFSDAQWQAIYYFYRLFSKEWIKKLILEDYGEYNKEIERFFQEATLNVVRRVLLNILDLEVRENKIIPRQIFVYQGGESTIKEICSELEKGKIVIVDTSAFSGTGEILIGSILAWQIFNKSRSSPEKGNSRPVISLLLEEAPRVLGKDILEKSSNIFETLAREGRKFNLGLVAITQIPSQIPKSILANMNTKVILGLEMQTERQAIIESSPQDLSRDSKSIASLDKGEAIISSTFSRIALPVKIPLFENLVKESKKNLREEKLGFEGIGFE